MVRGMRLSWVIVLLGLVGLLACSSTEQPAPQTSVSLTLTSSPSASVSVDGKWSGVTPVTVYVSPGTHDIVFEQEGFIPELYRIAVAENTPATVSSDLVIEDAGDDTALLALARAMEFEDWAANDTEAVAHRGAPDSSVTVLWPRGKVLNSSIQTLRIDVDESYGEGFLEVQTKKGDTTYRDSFDPEEMTTMMGIPADFRAGQAANKEIKWGVTYDDDRDAVWAKFTPVNMPRFIRRCTVGHIL